MWLIWSASCVSGPSETGLTLTTVGPPPVPQAPRAPPADGLGVLEPGGVLLLSGAVVAQVAPNMPGHPLRVIAQPLAHLIAGLQRLGQRRADRRRADLAKRAARLRQRRIVSGQPPGRLIGLAVPPPSVCA
jgi:hypothetical protein